MKKKLPIMMMSTFLLFGLVSCGGAGTSSTTTSSQTTSSGGGTTSSGGGTTTSSGGGTTTSSSEAGVTVESVTISGYDSTTVYDGTNVTLKATVKGSAQGLKVTWSSSDTSIATVTNGVVKFLSVTEDKQVTITATSRDDSTKKADVTFTVKHCVVDLKNSRGALDTSLLMDEGTIIADGGDTAVIFNDVYDTKWYVEAEISIDSQSETDNYPKVGIMTGTDSTGYWNQSTADSQMKNAFFYCDTMRNSASAGWTVFNFVTQNEEHTDWNWGGQIGNFAVSNEDKMQLGTPYKMGLLRDGIDYYLFAKKGEEITCYKHAIYSDIDAETPSYAWVGGWSTSMTLSGFKALTGSAVDAMFSEMTDFSLSVENQYIFVGQTYKLNIVTDVINYNKSLVTYSSSDDTVATVDSEGLITATDKPGEATITVSYKDISKTMKVIVTDDANLNVVLDGTMDDSLWSDTVKENKYQFKKNDTTYIDFYASRNSLGVYLFADYYVDTPKVGNTNEWWTFDNFECYFGTIGKLTIADMNSRGHDNATGQCWASAAQLNHNFEKGYITPAVQDEGTGLYHMTYELFMSYERLGVQRNDVVTFRMGSNPNAGWYNCSWWNSSKLADYAKITTDGISFSIDSALTCSEGHTYGDWETNLAPTCAEDGQKRRRCDVCGNYEYETIQKGAHTYSLDDVAVTTPSTCSTHGEGTVECTTCHQNVTVELPFDARNHSGHDFATGGCVCGEQIDPNSPVLFNRGNVGGWEDIKTWYFVARKLSGDFSVTVDFEHYGNVTGDTAWGGFCWKTVLPIVQDATPLEDGVGSPWVSRLDWAGWVVPWQSSELLGRWPNDASSKLEGWNLGDDFNAIIRHCNINLTFSRTGTTIRNDFVITALDGDLANKKYTYYTILFDVAETKPVNLAFISEYTNMTINSVKYNSVNFVA